MARACDRAAATAYAGLYDRVVAGFRPYHALLDEIAAIVARLAAPRTPLRILDISCGTGTAAARLAAAGHTVVGVDPVERLIEAARRRHGHGGGLRFHHVDIAAQPPPGAGSFDALLSMHTLYWHRDPPSVLEACRLALRPTGHGIFLTYGRPASVIPVFRDVLGGTGLRDAVHALRWLVPTATFELLRSAPPRYLSQEEFHRTLAAAGFDVTESRQTFLAGMSWLACTERTQTRPPTLRAADAQGG